jgi:hypothetical protein
MSQECQGNIGRPWLDASPPMDAATDITVYNANWDKSAWDHLKLREPLRLRVSGPEAAVFYETFHMEARLQFPWTGITEIDRAMAEAARRQRRSAAPAQRVAVTDDVLIAAIVAARLLGVAALLVLLALSLHAIDRGYRVEIEFTNQGALPWQQELVVHLTPQ